MAKALSVLGTHSEVTSQTRLVPAAECERVIATIDAKLLPLATRDEAMMLWAELISCYPDLLLAKRSADQDPESRREFTAYTRKMVEAFQQFSHFVGKQIVAVNGLPAVQDFRPKPGDVMKFGKSLVEKMNTAKGMAQRHIREGKDRAARRAKEAALEARRPDAETRKLQAERAMQLIRGAIRSA